MLGRCRARNALSGSLLMLQARAPLWDDGWYDPQLGLLVAIPRQTVLLAHRLGTAPVRPTLAKMAHLCEQVYAEESPADLPAGVAVSPDLYWVMDGVFHRLPVVRTGAARRVNVAPLFQAAVFDRLAD